MSASESTNTEKSDLELTQLSYKGSPYEDQSWEVVGELSAELEFVPMQIEVLPLEHVQVDKMFADYGGRSTEDTKVLWHLPEGLHYQSAASLAEGNEAEEEKKQSFTNDELNALLLEAEERGKNAVLAEMIERQNKKLGLIEDNIKTIISDMEKQIEEARIATEKEAMKLAVAVAEKIMHHSVEVNPEYVSKILDEAIGLCGSANISKIRISPQDLEFIELVGVSKKLKDTGSKLVFESDANVRAGCIIETSAGEVDYQLDKAFDRVKENILKVAK